GRRIACWLIRFNPVRRPIYAAGIKAVGGRIELILNVVVMIQDELRRVVRRRRRGRGRGSRGGGDKNYRTWRRSPTAAGTRWGRWDRRRRRSKSDWYERRNHDRRSAARA